MFHEVGAVSTMCKANVLQSQKYQLVQWLMNLCYCLFCLALSCLLSTCEHFRCTQSSSSNVCWIKIASFRAWDVCKAMKRHQNAKLGSTLLSLAVINEFKFLVLYVLRGHLYVRYVSQPKKLIYCWQDHCFINHTIYHILQLGRGCPPHSKPNWHGDWKTIRHLNVF